MTAPAPKSREEWVRAMDEIIWQYEHGGFGNWMKSRDAAIDSIMSLQSEVERLSGMSQDDLDIRFSELKATSLVVGSLCKSKGYDLRGLLDAFSGRPDIYDQVLDKLQIREVTLFIDERARQPK